MKQMSLLVSYHNKTNKSSSRIPKLFEWFAINAHTFFQENGFSIVNYWSVLFASILSWTVLLQLGFVLKLVTNLIRWCILDFHRKSYFDTTNLMLQKFIRKRYSTILSIFGLEFSLYKWMSRANRMRSMNAIRTHVPSRKLPLWLLILRNRRDVSGLILNKFRRLFHLYWNTVLIQAHINSQNRTILVFKL